MRRFADITRFHLRSASDILSILLLGLHPQEEIDALLKQLEVGIPAELLGLLALPLAGKTATSYAAGRLAYNGGRILTYCCLTA